MDSCECRLGKMKKNLCGIMLLVLMLMASMDLTLQAPAEFLDATTSSECFMIYQSKNSPICQEQTNLGKCIVRVNRFIIRPLQSTYEAQYTSIRSEFNITPEAGCDLGFNTVQKAAVADLTNSIRNVLKTQRPAVALMAGDLTPDECTQNFLDIAVNDSLTCSETIEFIKCDTLAMQVDTHKLSETDLQKRESDIQNILSKFNFPCKIDLPIIANGLPARQGIDMNSTSTIEPSPIPYPDCLSNSTHACQGRPDGDYFVCFPDCKPGFYIACMSQSMSLRICPFLVHEEPGSHVMQRGVFDPVKRECQPFSTFCPHDVQHKTVM